MLFRIKSALIACASIIALNSCTSDMEFKDTNVTPVKALFEPNDKKEVPLQASATAAVFFEWESAKAEDGGAPLYEVVFDKAGGDFSNPIYKVLSDGNGSRNYATISHKDLNKVGQMAGLESGETGDIQWSVVASRGIITTPVSIKRSLTITRLLGFAEVPSQLFISGEGVDESTAITCISPELDVFEAVVKLKGGKPFKLSSEQSKAGLTFYLDGNRIKEGDGEGTVAEDGVYRLNLDFSIASAKVQKIEKVEFFFSADNEVKFELLYVGNGVYSGVGSVDFHQESWGRDERYKLLMTYGDGSKTMWGADNGIDSTPNGAGADDAYWNAGEYGISQWDNKWKLDHKYDHNVPFRATLYLNEARRRHFVEDAGDAPAPEEPGELTAPATLTLSGDATEGGNLTAKKLDDNTFEIFTEIKGGKAFRAGDFHVEDGKLVVGADDITLADDGIYWMIFDFAKAEFTAKKITRFSVMDCWFNHGSAVLDLDYKGNGEWEATDISNDAGDGDNRYKFVMELGGPDTKQQWGCVKDYDKSPMELGDVPADYYDLKPVNDSQWDDKFKLNGDWMNKTVTVKVKLHDTYTHSIELAE